MFKGLFPAVITPFNDGNVDEEALRRHIAWLIENGVHGIVACGTTGESATLSEEELSNVVKIVVSEVNGRVPVIAGAGTNSTSKAIALAKLVTECGADATLQVTPYYNKPPQEGLFQHFKKIAEEVKTPHLLYNVPGRTAVNMLPETVERLSHIKNIVGLKEASGNLKQLEEIRGLVPPGFAIFSGEDAQNLEIFKRGGTGAISVTANVAPRETSDVWNLHIEGNREEAERTQIHLGKLNEAMFFETNPIPVKTAVSMMGFCKEEFRLPLTTMSAENRKKLEEVLQSYHLITV